MNQALPPRMRNGVARRAFSLVEILVTMVILAILAVILIPAVTRGLDRAKDVKCLANLKQLGIAISLYANDNEMRVPTGFARDPDNVPISALWQNNLDPYLNLPELTLRSDKNWQCPKALNYTKTFGGATSYAINYFLAYPGPAGDLRTRFLTLPQGRRFVLVTEQIMQNNEYLGYWTYASADVVTRDEMFRHGGKTNVLWSDLSVSPTPYEELMKDVDDPDKSVWLYKW